VNGTCCGRLGTGHMGEDGDRRLTCEVCSLNRPSVLHIHQGGEEVNTDSSHPKEPSLSGAHVSLHACGHTGAGNSGVLPIDTPIQVKSNKGD